MKIIKQQQSFRKYQHWIMALMWLGFGAFYFLDEKPVTFIILGYILVGIGELTLQLYYQKKGRAEESIIWNEEEVIVQELFQKPKVYRIIEIDNITITTNNFLLKSGAAKGVMLDLKGFSEEDIETLRTRFSTGPVLQHS